MEAFVYTFLLGGFVVELIVFFGLITRRLPRNSMDQ